MCFFRTFKKEISGKSRNNKTNIKRDKFLVINMYIEKLNLCPHMIIQRTYSKEAK